MTAAVLRSVSVLVVVFIVRSACARSFAQGTNHHDNIVNMVNQSLGHAIIVAHKLLPQGVQGSPVSPAISDLPAGRSLLSARMLQQPGNGGQQLGNVQYTQVYGGTSTESLYLSGPSNCPGNSYVTTVYLHIENIQSGRLTGIYLHCNDEERSFVAASGQAASIYATDADVIHRLDSNQGFNTALVYAGEAVNANRSDIVSGMTIGNGDVSLSAGSANGLYRNATAELAYDIPNNAVIVGVGCKYGYYVDSLYFTYKTQGSAAASAPSATMPFSSASNQSGVSPTIATTGYTLGTVQYTESYGGYDSYEDYDLNPCIFGPTICPGDSFVVNVRLQHNSALRLNSIRMGCSYDGIQIQQDCPVSLQDESQEAWSDDGFDSASAYAGGTDGQSGIVSGLAFSSTRSLSTSTQFTFGSDTGLDEFANTTNELFPFSIPPNSVIVGFGAKASDYFYTVFLAYKEIEPYNRSSYG